MRKAMRPLMETKSFLASLLAMSLLLLASCDRSPKAGTLVLTQVKRSAGETNVLDQVFDGRGVSSRIVALDPGKAEEGVSELSSGFFAAMSPEISYDGRFLLFAGKRLESDPWRIWEMDLADRSLAAISPEDAICLDPAYLPGDQVVYSRYVPEDITPGHYALERCRRNGEERQRITFSPDDYRASTVLHDGRILVLNRQVYPQAQEAVWKVLRPDGTKEELFYASEYGELLPYRARETADGKIFFLERDRESQSLGLASVSYNLPHSGSERDPYDLEGDLLTIFGTDTGELLVAYRDASADRIGLSVWDPEKAGMERDVLKDPDYDILQASVITSRQRPKKLPSEVDPAEATALLMCQDVNLSSAETMEAVQLEVIGVAGSLGVIGLENDGSVYLRIKADTPFQLQALDAEGKVVKGPSSWITMRPNERRGCVGCHAGHDRVPENRQPLSVQKEPVVIPRVIENNLAKNSK